MSDVLLVEVADGIAVLTINRPQSRNAINGAVAAGIAGAVGELDGRKDVSVLILTGAGGTFSAGMDLKGFLTGDNPMAGGGGFGGITERPPAKPIIAAVEGYALADGEALAAARELATRIAANAPLALAATKRVIVESRGWPMAHAFSKQAEILAPVFGSKDAIEGAAAFTEKRTPHWRGE